ncbi:hypothetical protein ACFL2V_10390 [Pseudomonadota bacterium]
MALDLSEYELGESNEIIKLASSEDVAEATLDIAQKAQRSFNIFTHSLDRRVYNDQALYNAILKLATYSRHSLVRILIKDSTNAVKRGSRLVELSYRISSRVQIRKPAMEYLEENDEFVIADKCGLLLRRNPNRYEGELDFNAAMKARQALRFFDTCWEHSAPDPELRRLHL